MNRVDLIRGLASVAAAAALASACAAPQPSTPAPTSAPATASAATALDYGDQPGDGAALTPGRYVVTSVEPFSIAFTVPLGWYKGSIDFVVWDSDSNASIGFAAPDNLYVDPCAVDKGLRDPAVRADGRRSR